MKIYVAAVQALRKKERQHETQLTTKIGGKTSLCLSYLQEEQVVELEETWNTRLLQLDELKHKLPTTTSSGDPEIHHHQQAHELHIVAALASRTASQCSNNNNNNKLHHC